MVQLFEERVVNNLLLLHLIDRANQKGNIEDNLKVQKMVFLAQKNFIDKKLKGFAYNFFRWERGPFSADLNNDLMKLIRNDFVRWESWKKRIYLTKEGNRILEACKGVLEENKNFLKLINEITDKYANIDPEKIKDEVYKMKLMVPRVRERMVIKEMRPGQMILFRPSMKRMKREFKIGEEWQATLEVIFDEEVVADLRKAYNDAREGNVHEQEADI